MLKCMYDISILCAKGQYNHNILYSIHDIVDEVKLDVIPHDTIILVRGYNSLVEVPSMHV